MYSCFEFGLCKSTGSRVDKSEPPEVPYPLNRDIMGLNFNPVPRISD